MIRPEDEPPGYALHKHLAEFMREGEWWRLAPYPGISPANNARGVWCMGTEGGSGGGSAEYVVFSESGGNATVTLPGAAERPVEVRCEWLQPLTGERGETTARLGARARLAPPWTEGGPFVVRLRVVG